MNSQNISDPFLVGIDTRQIYLLSDICTTIGRSKENDIVVVTDLSLSRRHAVITKVEGEYYLRDLRSANGTLVNGHAVEGMVQLKPNDEVFLGRTRMLYCPSQERLAEAKPFPGESDTPIVTQQAVMALRSTVSRLKAVLKLVFSKGEDQEQTIPSLRESVHRLKQLHKNEVLKVLQKHP